MTLRLVDVSRYQVERTDPLDLARAKAAGYHIANVALTGGRGYVSGSWAKTYLDRAAVLGMGRCTYHWLDGRTSGTDQARATLSRLAQLFGGARTGFAHAVDVEESGKNGITPPTWAHVRDYVHAMQQGLGRHIVLYTGDWWWRPRGWSGAALTPWLMGAPMDGSLQAYPGDESPRWSTDFGGWPNLSIMQWGVQPLPGTGDCSLSAIRDHGVWADLTGGDTLMAAADPANAQPEAWAGPRAEQLVIDELMELGRSLPPPVAHSEPRWGPVLPLVPRGAGEACAPVIQAEMSDWIDLGGSNSGCVGNAAHATGFHRGANFIPDRDYSRRRDPNGADGPFVSWNYACAGDFAHRGDPRLRNLHRIVLARLMSGAYPMIGEFIVQPWADRPVMYWARWEGVDNLREYTGSGHDLWSHVSWFRSRADQRTYMWRDAVALTSDDIKAVADATAKAVAGFLVNVTPGAATAKNQPWSRVDGYGSKERKEILEAVKALNPPLAALLAFARAEAAEVPPSAVQIAEATRVALAADTVENTAAALFSVLGREKAEAVARVWAATGQTGS